jgi:hypothetical protein
VGSSFTRYLGRGFWSRDASIELWLCLLAQEVWRLDTPPEWLRAAAEDWQLQATTGFGGCVSAGLDGHAPTAERAAIVLDLAERTLAGLRERGETLPAAWLNSLGLGGPGSVFLQDVPAEGFVRVGEAFVQLLRGEISWDAATSPLVEG